MELVQQHPRDHSLWRRRCGSHVCISVHGVGTYCLDTADHTWSQVGEWTLPFHGKVEYVPELKLWFGLSAAGGQQNLAAADLSDVMDSQPCQLVGGPWKELDHLPDEWKECKDPQFVSLGSGRFCIARFFQEAAGSAGDQVIHENAAVFTGLEVNSSGKGGTAGKVELQMTPHRSRRVNSTSIEALFYKQIILVLNLLFRLTVLSIIYLLSSDEVIHCHHGFRHSPEVQ